MPSTPDTEKNFDELKARLGKTADYVKAFKPAQVDGADAWRRFGHVTFPHLRGVIFVTALLLMVANLNSFIIPWIMTGGGPAGASDIWITAIYNIAFGRVRFGLAAEMNGVCAAAATLLISPSSSTSGGLWSK